MGALRFKTGVDSTAYDNDAAMKKQHEDAKSDASKPEPNSEGVRRLLLPRRLWRRSTLTFSFRLLPAFARQCEELEELPGCTH